MIEISGSSKWLFPVFASSICWSLSDILCDICIEEEESDSDSEEDNTDFDSDSSQTNMISPNVKSLNEKQKKSYMDIRSGDTMISSNYFKYSSEKNLSFVSNVQCYIFPSEKSLLKEEVA